jgi:hypothetical protein
MAATVEADDLRTASAIVEEGLSAYFAGAEYSAQPVRLVACRESDFEAELMQSMLPAFMGVGEIAAELEVSKQRASELSRDSRFPQPVADLAAGPVWLASSVRNFAKNWSRQSGRPRRS